ncbi:MAG TPA: hypothetical protein VEM93_03715 [Actinomycetota bacterium]|nr:hypothetical protein [Actinomycetota bacterium]
MATPSSCRHWLTVSRSNITRFAKFSWPVTANVSVRPSTRREKATALLHRGQKVTAIGLPPTTSFTISWYARIWTG